MSDESDKDIAFIEALAAILKQSELSEIEVEREYAKGSELKVRLARTTALPPAPMPVAAAAGMHAPASQPAPAPRVEVHADEGPDMTNAVTSPMVGTAYLSPEPGAAPFVTDGDIVEEGQTLLIIEAMKTMNQIPAPQAGRVRAVLIENAEPVEFGEPLMIIE